jgi:cation transport regulator
MTYYTDLEHLPKDVQEVLPLHAQVIFADAYNDALDESFEVREPWLEREDAARREAWAAVKRIYRKDDRTGLWRRRGYQLPAIPSKRILSRPG